MDDINFEELDKAVNSALQQTAPKAAPQQEEPAGTAPESAGETISDQSMANSAPVSQTVVQKRRGQFMDMVHPSSDMIKQSVSPRPSRQAPALQPLNPAIVETAHQDASQEEPTSKPAATFSEPAVSQADEDDDTSGSAMKSEWPDPLDVMEQTEHEKQDDDAPNAFSESTTLTGDIDEEENDSVVPAGEDVSHTDAQTDENESQEMGTSPFINGADLEKRPLGAFTDTDSVPGESAVLEDTTDSTDEEDGEVDPMLDEMKQELPAEVAAPQELAPEVVSVESDDPERLNDEIEDTETASGSVPEDSTGVATSISPQYTNTEAPSDDQADHPVFDTKEYHQPLTPPAKKSHTRLIATLVIIVLALLGAGAWYAVAILKLI